MSGLQTVYKDGSGLVNAQHKEDGRALSKKSVEDFDMPSVSITRRMQIGAIRCKKEEASRMTFYLCQAAIVRCFYAPQRAVLEWKAAD